MGLKSEQALNQAEIIGVKRLSISGLTFGYVCVGRGGVYPLRSGFRKHWNTLRARCPWGCHVTVSISTAGVGGVGLWRPADRTVTQTLFVRSVLKPSTLSPPDSRTPSLCGEEQWPGGQGSRSESASLEGAIGWAETGASRVPAMCFRPHRPRVPAGPSKAVNQFSLPSFTPISGLGKLLTLQRQLASFLKT